MTRRGNTMIKWAGTPALAMGLMVGTAQQVEAEVIYDENFGGGAVALNGTAPDTTTGGNIWTASTDWLENGTAPTPALDVTTTDDDSAFLAFTPTDGKIYTLTATLTQPSGGTNSGWIAIGFTGGDTTTGSFWANDAAPWLLWRPSDATSSNQVVSFLGTGTTGGADEGTATGTATFDIVLNTEADGAWTAEWFVNGSSVRGPEVVATEAITHVGFGRENSQSSTFTNFELTVVPEPGSLALLSLGGLCVLRRRRSL